jgi:hypothetical protein
MKKMNMVEKFGAIKAMLNGEKVENFSINEAIEFIEGRIEQVNKKNAGGGERKPTATQIANEKIKDHLVMVLRSTENPVTIKEMQDKSEILAGLSNQKISALLTQLVKIGGVSRTTVKGKAHFALIR